MKLWPDLVTDELRNERKSICNTCDRNNLGFCLECGCLIHIKTHLKIESCPLNKWSDDGPVVYPNFYNYDMAGTANTENNSQSTNY